MNSILEVNHLTVKLKQKKNMTKEIVKDVSFCVEKGSCLGILGESGSGKSMSMKAILGLLNKDFLVSGSVLFQGEDLLGMQKEKIRKLRGSELTMILQNPMSCFDPLYRIGDQMKETWMANRRISGKDMEKLAIQTLERVHIKDPFDVLRKYPHQLSGGMLQRIMIGISLSMNPSILIADEPTTALDAITRKEILRELKRIKDSKETSMILISHDLSVIASIADQVIVMNQGRVVDSGTYHEILHHAKDPYTLALIESRKRVSEKYFTIRNGEPEGKWSV